MKTSIEVSNLTKKRISPDFVKKIVRKTVKLSRLKSARQAGADWDLFEISVVFVGEAESRKINRKYRGICKSTDVLSFNLDSGYNKKGKAIEGELVLCPDVIAKNARENGVKFEREFVFVLAHGVLHVLGWKHGVKMYALQDRIANV